MTWTHFPWSLLDPKRNFLSNWVKKVWIHKQLLEMKFLLCWTRIQPFYLCLWSWLRTTVNSDLSKKRYLRNCLCKENLICFKHKVWWKRKLTVREGKIYFVFIWAGLSFRDSNTKRLFVCLFCSGNAILKQLVILEKLKRRSKYNCEKGIIHAHINQNIIFLLKKKKKELLFDLKAYLGYEMQTNQGFSVLMCPSWQGRAVHMPGQESCPLHVEVMQPENGIFAVENVSAMALKQRCISVYSSWITSSILAQLAVLIFWP